MTDYNKAAVLAAETLIRYGVKATPISPLRILKDMDNVIAMPFSDLSEVSGICQDDMLKLFDKNRDAVSCLHREGNHQIYMVAYNSLLPFAMIQRALARELGRVVLKHEESTQERTDEAVCFAKHLLCPRPLIHTIQMLNLRLTVDMMARLTGMFDQDLVSIRRTPATEVPPRINRFLRNQLMPFIMNFFEYYRNARPNDGSALADLGTYMDGYEE